MRVHPIEAESYRILEGRLDLSSWPEGPAAVAARVVHATADPALVDGLVVDERAVTAGVAALLAGAPVVCDVEMVRAGIPSVRATSAIAHGAPDDATASARGFTSRTAAGMASLAARHPAGALVVVGCAPTALEEVNRLIAAGSLRPALVVGVPVGFVGAAEAKEHLLEVAGRADVPVIALRGERGGVAVAAAIVNALARRAGAQDTTAHLAPGCFFIGHGTRSTAGEDELRRFVEAAASRRPDVETRAGYIEFIEPGLDDALDDLVSTGVHTVVAVPLVLLGAGHMKDDGPAALSRARARHPGVTFTYARDLGVHPDVLAVVGDRARECAERRVVGTPDALVVVGRGSTDPDANADLAKAARLLADGRGLATPLDGDGATGCSSGTSGAPPLALVVPAFVSLARPSVTEALAHCVALGARRIAVVPYFLFDGLLVERIRAQVSQWNDEHPSHVAVAGAHMGIDPRLVDLAWHRYDEASGGGAHMNCDGCVYRAPLPGYEHRVGTPPFG